MKKVIKWSLLIVWMVVIFKFSNQPAVVSDEKSKLVISLFNLIGFNINSVFGELSDFLIRKTAHFLEYFILYVLIYNVVKEEFIIEKATFISILVVFLYACTDEFHQTFIIGREGRFIDVIIDTCGGVTAAFVTFFIPKVRYKHIRK